MKRISAITLLELIIAVTLMVLLSLSYFNIDYFGRFHASNSDRKSRLQNGISLVLEQLSREVVSAIGDIGNGDVSNPEHPAVTITTIGGNPAIKVGVDGNQNGKRDAGDHITAYRFTGSSGGYQVWYYSGCNDDIDDINEPDCKAGAAYSVLAKHILDPIFLV